MRFLKLALVALSLVSCSRDSGPIPRPEHPRPDLQRPLWLSLNGQWEFRFDPQNLGLDEGWERPRVAYNRRIQVPFCWESKLSGIEEKVGQRIGWYRRRIRVPRDWQGRRVWLRFEAVDYEARVWVNDAEVGRHEGGYTPFAFDITDHVKPGDSATVCVRAFDATDREQPTGKQVASWYTFTSGIWQTVWLEARPETYLETIRLTPQQIGSEWLLRAEAEIRGGGESASIRIAPADATVAGAESRVPLESGSGAYAADLRVDSPKLWSPANPHLYDLRIEVTGADGQTDIVDTYFGLRTIERAAFGGADYESVLLNGEPIYLRGALDQSFNPDGIYTAPSDDFLREDMERAKESGFNFLRIHIKPDEPRRLYWADKLGVLIMEDMPNTWEHTDRARAAWESTMREVISRDRNHPAIFSWVLFNETWGLGGNEYRERRDIQQWVQERWREVKELDPSRLVEDNSANRRDHVVTDLNTWHFYIDDEERAWQHIEEVVQNTFPGSAYNYAPGHAQDAAPLMNSEYGAVGAGSGDRDIAWGFHALTTRLRRYEKIQGYVFTELTDVEFEHNGFYNYDRSPKEFGYDEWVKDMTPADLQREDFVGFDSPPVIVAAPGEEIRIPAFVSHWSDAEGEVLLKRWLIGVDDLGREIRVDLDSKPVVWKRYRVTSQPPLEVTLPDRPFAGAMAMELVDEAGRRLAANYVNVVTTASPPATAQPVPAQRVEQIDPRRAFIRVRPQACQAAQWDGASTFNRVIRRSGLDKFFFSGAGAVEYRFRVPEAVIQANPVQLGFLAEIATKTRDERLDWPQQIHPDDYPQTDRRKHPGRLNIYINGHPLEPIEVADDPADARGVLSHLAKQHHGSYGYLVKGGIYLSGLPNFVPQLRGDPFIRVVLEVPAGPGAAGLSVYGEGSGRYPLAPTIVLETNEEFKLGEPAAD